MPAKGVNPAVVRLLGWWVSNSVNPTYKPAMGLYSSRRGIVEFAMFRDLLNTYVLNWL